MEDMKQALKVALEKAVAKLGAEGVDVPVQDVPDNKPGDYGSPAAFALAKRFKKSPVEIANDIVANLELPKGIARVEAVGPYINFFVDIGSFVEQVIASDLKAKPRGQKIVVEHTSVNPNKEAHVGHLRNIVLGDSTARILRADGYDVEVQNYIDDTGRQAAESLYAVEYFSAEYDGSKKYDHWLGELYVALGKAKAIGSEEEQEKIEAGVVEIMHKLERGELRNEVIEILNSNLETYWSLGAEYDLLVWESNVVDSGFMDAGLSILKNSDYVSTATEGKYKDALIMDVSEFIPGLEESNVVLVRSNGNAMYVCKDIGYHLWKVGALKGLKSEVFATQPSGKVLYTSSATGEVDPDGQSFGGGVKVVNVIDIRQRHPQEIVKTALKLSDDARGADAHHHLAYEVVKLEGQDMSGRKGITVAIDTALEEIIKRTKETIHEKNPDLANSDEVARQVGLGALRFGMIKSEATRIIDFRWEQALNLQGDSAPYIQYAHARACSILRAAKDVDISKADWSKIGELELALAKTIVKVPDVIALAAKDFAPHTVAQYALELATSWNGYFNHKDDEGKVDTKVLDAEEGLKEARVALVMKVRDTLAHTLDVLGIAAPQEM